MEYKEIIEDVFLNVKKMNSVGQVATYIPELAVIDPEMFGVHISTIEKGEFGLGNYQDRFSIQSIAKVLSLSLAFRMLGEKIWDRLGVEPSGTSFDSLSLLEMHQGIPRNPFVNAGALVICDILISQLKHPKEEFLTFCREVSGLPDLGYSTKIANSEKSVGYRNIAVCNYIKSFGNIHNTPEEVLDFYFNMCSLEMTCQELSNTFLYLADNEFRTNNKMHVLNMSQAKRVNAVMQTCGFYDESGEFAFKVGLPGKSGVGGGIIAVHPDKYCIAVWSPKLNEKGNSYRGMNFLELFTTSTQSSIF
ncbi:MAG: glutaminase [Bacteroidales bacterium]|jgi:glutaminase|nr:glutaminase [Bacteroidales bacterium]